MPQIKFRMLQRVFLAFASCAMLVSPAMAQITKIDPNDAINADLGKPPAVPAVPTAPVSDPAPAASTNSAGTTSDSTTTDGVAVTTPASSDQSTYKEDDLIGAAENVFGKGAQGLAKLIQNILKKQGEPNGYIVGREGGGAFVVGLRYGSGTLHHKIEGDKPAYWTGPSIGFDAGANAGSTFMLVYNLYDTEELYRRFPSAEGVAYLVGGFNASYLRSGDIVVIPIRVGAGLRLGANVGYMKFSKKQKWLPF